VIFSLLQSESKHAIIALPFFKPHNNSYNMFLKTFQYFFKAIQIQPFSCAPDTFLPFH